MLQLTNHPGETTSRRGAITGRRTDESVKHPAFKALVALNIIGACVAAYLYFNREETPAALQPEPVQMEQTSAAASPESKPETYNRSASSQVNKASVEKSPEVKQRLQPPVASSPIVETPAKKEPTPLPAERMRTKSVPSEERAKVATTEPAGRSSRITESVSYTVAGPQVYFHNQPDPSTRRNAFINRWNKAVLKPLDEKNGFVYIVYTNQWGQTSKGWMPKKQLKQLN